MAPEPYKPQEYTPQTFKNTSYASYRPDYEYKPFKAEYKPYIPTRTGIWGEKARSKRVRIQPDTTPKDPAPAPAPRQYRSQKNLKLFDSYSHPKGPDIKIPEYKAPMYNPTPHQPKPYNPPNYISSTGPRAITPMDPLRRRTDFNVDRMGTYRGNAEYKLTKQNNLALRHWKGNYVDDTVMARPTREPKPYRSVLGGTLGGPKEKYKMKEKPAAKPESKPKKTPRETRKRTPTPPPPIIRSRTPKRSRTPEKNKQSKRARTPERMITPENSPSPERDDRDHMFPYLAPVPVSPPVQKNKHTQPHGYQQDMRTKPMTPVEEPVYRSSPETRRRESPRDVSVYLWYRGSPVRIDGREMSENRTQRARYANAKIMNTMLKCNVTTRKLRDLFSVPPEVSNVKIIRQSPKMVQRTYIIPDTARF